MAETQRPLSPHLQVYRWQLTSVMSILHRATGVLLALAALLLGYWVLAVAGGPETYATAASLLGSWYGRALLVAVLFSLYYHLCNGVRHLAWDLGLGLELNTAYASGYAVVIVTVILTALTGVYGGLL